MSFLHWRPELSLPELGTSHVLALTTAGLLTAYVVHKIRQKKYYFPPGPRPLPILGNLLSFSSEPMYLALTNMAEKYGDIFTIYMGPNPMVVLNSTDVLRETFVKKAAEFSDRPIMVSTNVFGGHDSIIFGQYAPRWRKQRKIAHSALRKFATGSPMEVLLQRSFSDTCILIDKEGGQPCDIQPKLALMTSNVVSSMAFGKTFEMDDPFFSYITSELDKMNESIGNGVLADIFPILQYFPNPTLSAARNVMQKLTTALEEAWNEHLQNHNPDQLTDFIHYLIETKNELQEDDENEILLEEKHFHNIFSDLFLAGMFTTRTTLTWVLLLCATHPEVQVKMQAEIDRVVGADQPICLNHRPQLIYTEAVIQEAMRIFPTNPLAVPRATHCDVEIRGYTLPKGTWVVPNLWAIQHCASNWPDPDRFLPERHIQEDGTLDKSDSLLPFSTGRRRCTGEVVAKTSLHMFTAMLFQRYSFLPPEGVNLDVTPLPGAICIPPRYEIVAHRRKSN